MGNDVQDLLAHRALVDGLARTLNIEAGLTRILGQNPPDPAVRAAAKGRHVDDAAHAALVSDLAIGVNPPKGSAEIIRVHGPYVALDLLSGSWKY